ncbi:MAG TPA: right-handed parallel beta-helix repeat-containing protein [Verrucomicrobiae bacterium]
MPVKKMFTLVLAGTIFAGSIASAAVFTVTNVNNNGAGSLRQAILDANASPGADTINFNIPGSGVQTIAPTNALPDITNIVAINGYSQPGSSANSLANGDNAVILIRLDGFKITSGFPIGLNFSGVTTSGSSVRGLCIVRFSNGVKANEASNITIAGNWVGMDVDGVARGTSNEGIYITSFFNPGNNIVIGGTSPADRNVISGNSKGVWFSGSTTANSFVQGNFIGTDPTGTLPRGNLFGGVYIFTCTNITAGGAVSGARNIISGATAAGGTGVTVQGGPNNLIQGNLIGTDVSGQYDLGNISDGIFVTSSQNTRITGNEIVNNRANGINLSSSSGTVMENNFVGTDASTTRPLGNALAGIAITGNTNRVGGLNAGQANVVQFNGGAGVTVTSSSAVQNEISANQIFDNGGLGIDLGTTGITTNDVLDADTGANGLQNYPVLTDAAVAFSSLSVQGTLNSKAGATCRLEFFATPNWDAAGIAEGQTFLGSTNVTTDASGDATFNAVFATVPATNLLVTATATDAAGNTSEFSAGIAITTTGVATPSLAIAQASGEAGASTTTVTWPSAASFFALEKTDSLKPPVQWQTVTSDIVDSAGMKTFVITNGSGGTNQFFRLKKP